MNGKRLLLPALVMLLAACASAPANQAPLVWSEENGSAGGDTGPAAPPEDAPEKTGPVEKVTVEHAVIEELMKILNREQILTADLIEIDASLVPFQIAIVSVADPAYVEKMDLSSKARKTTGFRLRTRMQQPALERDFPHVRLGDGISVMAAHEIRVKLYMKVTYERPMFLRIRGTGDAVYRDVKSGSRISRDQITIYAEVVRRGDGSHKVNQRIL